MAEQANSPGTEGSAPLAPREGPMALGAELAGQLDSLPADEPGDFAGSEGLSGCDADTLAPIDELRASGTDAFDPIRFTYLASLARRAASQPETIRQSLMVKIAAEAEALAKRHQEAVAAGPLAQSSDAATTVSPLAGLLGYISELAATANVPPATPASLTPRHSAPRKPAFRSPRTPELKSVAFFRKTWSKLSTEQQLTQTLAQAPENAGPMNSQHLVLRSLQVMRDLSPAYLQGFMSCIDALIWLEEAAPVKAANRTATAESPAKSKGKPRSNGR